MRFEESFEHGVKVIKAIIEDSDYASEQLKQERLSVCSGCEFKQGEDACSKCSCLLVNRVAFVESFCPEGKW